MSLDHFVSVFSATISFVGLMLVVLQLRDSARKQEMQSLVEIYDINRQLLSLGFSHPKLFDILEDKKHVEPLLEKRYLQLWLNQLELSHAFLERSMLKVEFKEMFDSNLIDFMALENMRKHWKEFGKFYPASFQVYVQEIMQKGEPPKTAHPGSGR